MMAGALGVPTGPAPTFAVVNGTGGSLEERLAAAQGERGAVNLQRQLAFVGFTEGEYIELQALAVGGRDRTRAVHATLANAARLVGDFERLPTQGVYLMTARLRPGVETRHAKPGNPFDIPKGCGTKDSDIAARRVLPFDFDSPHVAQTSATDAEMAMALPPALRCLEYLSSIVGENALALIASGNGYQVHAALDSIGSTDELTKFVSSILHGAAALFSTETGKLDVSLSDPKRILPACGTTKRKGIAGIPERPHRRTAIVTPDHVHRLTLDELQALHARIRQDCDEAGRIAMDKAMGIKHAPKPTTPTTPRTEQSTDAWSTANALDPREVAAWLGIDPERPTCPGCGNADGSSVAILDHGFKCSHNSCAGKGRKGFRTNVDLTIEVRGLDAKDAYAALAERFGLGPLPDRQPQAEDYDRAERDAIGEEPPAGFFEDEAPPDESPSPAILMLYGPEIAAPLPELEYLVPEIGLVAGGGAPHLVAGYGYAGKTVSLQAMLVGLAAGTTVWGAYKVSRQFRVRHVDKEQGDTLTRRRYQRICKAAGVDLVGLGQYLGTAIMPPLTMTAGCRDQWKRIMEGVDLILVDSMRAASPGQDENSSEIREGLDMLGEISNGTGCRAIVIHHARKPNEDSPGGRFSIRGSSAIFDALDCAYVFAADKGEPIKVTHEKARSNGDTVDDFALVVSDVPSDADPRWGLKVEVRGAELIAQRREERAADALKERTRRDAQVVAKVLAGSPGLGTRELRTATGLSGDRLALAVEGLKHNVEVVEEKTGKTTKRRHFWRGTP